MYENYLFKAINALRKNNKVPHLNIRYPAITSSNGDITFLCDTCKDCSNTNEYWISFYVTIPLTDFDLKLQQIDKETNPQNKRVSDEDRIVLRVGYRIYRKYRETIKDISAIAKSSNP